MCDVTKQVDELVKTTNFFKDYSNKYVEITIPENMDRLTAIQEALKKAKFNER